MALSGREDNEGNGTKSTGVENDGEITGFRHDDKITGVDSDNESTELESKGATENVDELALIEESIAGEERDIAEGTNLLEGTETETEEAQKENVMHPYLQVPTVEHTYNLWKIRHLHPDCTNRYGFQSTIIHCALTKLSVKRGINKFKKRGKKR